MSNVTTALTVSNTTDTRETERPSRARTLLLLVSLLDRLPAPEAIHFSENYADNLRVELATPSDWDAWVQHFDAHVWTNRRRHGNTLQCDADKRWHGWRLGISVCTTNIASDDRLSADEVAVLLEPKPEPAPIPATLACPSCSHTEYASEDDPDAGLGQMHNHILWEHADRDPDVTLKLLAQVTATAVTE